MNLKINSKSYKRFLLKSATIGVSLGRPNQIIKGGSINRTDTSGEMTSAIFKEKQLNCSCVDSLTNKPTRPIGTFESPDRVVRGNLLGTLTKLSNRNLKIKFLIF